MSNARGPAAVGVLGALGLGLVVLVSPGAPGLTAAIYLFVVSSLVLVAILVRLGTALPRAEPPRLPHRPRPHQAGQLESVARALELAEASEFDLHNVLRPIVREIAVARLVRRGVSLDRQPERARALLGAPAWELVRPDREVPVGRSGRGGCSRDQLREIVCALEAI